jgi:hypothetical protein
MGQVAQAYRMSLLLLERMLYLGLDTQYYDQVEKALSPDGIHRINVDGILRSDLGFNIRRMHDIFRPEGVHIFNTGYNWFIPRRVNYWLNHYVEPIAKQFKQFEKVDSHVLTSQIETFQDQKFSEFGRHEEAQKFGFFARAKKAARQIGVYLVSGVHILTKIYDIEAREKALILVMRQRRENIPFDTIETWLADQKDFYNPLTNKPFVFNNSDNRALVFDNSTGQSIPTYFIPTE